jgi:multidrug efflux pump subunit AcrA (membrane-fusion protein)
MDRRRLLVPAVPCVLALGFALIRPAWMGNAPAVRAEETHQEFNVRFGSSGPAVDVQQPTRARIAEIVHAPATIKSGGEVAICAPFDGRVRELCVDEGDAVVASQVIFRLDPIEYDDKAREAELELARRKAALLESEAEFKEAEHKWNEAQKEPSTLTEARLKIGQSALSRERAAAELENAVAKLARAVEMNEKGVGTKQDVDAAEAEKKVQSIALRIAEGDLDLARKTLTFQERTWETDRATAEKAYDTAQTHVNRGKADVIAGDVALFRARRDRDRCDVRTPIAGVVTRRNVNDGELTSRPATADQPQYIVSDMSHMLAYADVDEGDVVKIAPGQASRVRVMALGDEIRLTGKVIDVANRAFQKTGDDTKSFRARILLSPKDDRLRPDMTASAEIETRVTKDDALRVPMQAVLHKSKKDISGEASEPVVVSQGVTSDKKHAELQDWVFVLDAKGEKVVAKTVSLGVSDGEMVEIKADSSKPDQLTDKDWVVLGPYRSLENMKVGDLVRATRKEPPKPDAIAAATTATPASKSSAQ